MEIVRYWRVKKGLDALLNCAKFSDQRSLQQLMVEAGSRDGTAEDALNAYYSYVNRRQSELLQSGIDERSPIEEKVLVET